MNMQEVAAFFKDLIANKTLNIKTLPKIGFDFLANYFLSANEQKGFLEKIAPPVKEKKQSTAWVIWDTPVKKEE